MISLHDLMKMKEAGKKIAMITCYDYISALIIEKTSIDCVLVGDTSSMLMHGASNTLFSTVEQISVHIQAVSRGIKSKFIIGDLPFMSYHKSVRQTLEAVETLMRAGAHAIKLEGENEEIVKTIRAIINAGVPVMGHLGLTPQHIHQLGGFKVQGKTKIAAEQLLGQALTLEKAGCFSIVLECIPASLTKTITQALSIPTIGIGAGADSDGQVLVFHDLLGLQVELKPKFVKRYLNGAQLFEQGIEKYTEDVKSKKFPLTQHTYEG